GEISRILGGEGLGILIGIGTQLVKTDSRTLLRINRVVKTALVRQKSSTGVARRGHHVRQVGKRSSVFEVDLNFVGAAAANAISNQRAVFGGPSKDHADAVVGAQGVGVNQHLIVAGGIAHIKD